MKIKRKSLFSLGLFICVLSWSVGTTGVWLFARYHQGVRTSYWNLLLPWRWDEHQAAVGAAYLSQAEELAKSGDFAQAFVRLKMGVNKTPQNLRGRLLLADFYVVLKRPDQAKDLLLSSADYFNDDPAYVRAVADLLLNLQEDRLLQTFAQQHLQAFPTNSEVTSILALSAARAAFNRGNYQEAENFLRRYLSDTVPEKAALLIQINWERGLQDLALLELREAISSWPTRRDFRTLLVTYLRATGDRSRHESAVIENIAADPMAFEPRIDYIRLLHERGNRADESSEIDKFIGQFSTDTAAMLVLADLAANTGQPSLVAKAGATLGNQHELTSAMALLEIEAHVVARNFITALDLIADYSAKYPEWASQYAPVLSGLKAVAACGLGRKEEATLFLDELFSHKNIQAENLVAVSNRLSALNANDLAIRTLRRAVKADPQNESAFSNLVKLELEEPSDANLAASLKTFLAIRKPAREIAAKAYLVLGSDRHLFTPGQSEVLIELKNVLNGTTHQRRQTLQ